MALWDDLTGQRDAVATLREAARRGSSAMTHAWLLTGPPGSGRSNLALAFAGALLGADDDPGVEAQVRAGSHPDLLVVRTEAVIISIENARRIVSTAYRAPSVASRRVIVIEDADRMPERTSNTVLKVLEEPPSSTVFVLCAPSESDLLPTIRSRVRTLRLGVPEVGEVAQLLSERHGVSPERALVAAREAQSHIGMAARLATDDEARRRRRRTLEIVLAMRSVSDAMMGAAELHDIASADGAALNAERDAAERAEALRSLGVEPGGTVPPKLRSQIKALEEEQKKRARRGLRDGLDRILVDLLSLHRDVLLVSLGAGLDLVNESLRDDIEALAGGRTPEAVLAAIDAVTTARRRIAGNVAPLLALEAMLVAALPPRT